MYFEGLEDIPVAEEKLCGFEKFYKVFKQKEWQAIRSLEERHHAIDDIFNRKKGGGVVSVLHSEKVNNHELVVDNETRQLSSFPWQAFTRNAKELLKKEEQKGKAYIFHPNAMLFHFIRILEISFLWMKFLGW